MEKEKNICRYKNKITGWKCPYEALHDSSEGFCIFHDRRKGKDIKKFNEGIKKILEDKDSDAYHFEGFFFPDSISFENFEFKKSVFFHEAELSGKYTDFRGTKFSGELTEFRNAKFSGAETSFYRAKFSGKKITFRDAKFSGRVTDFSAAFSGEDTDFDETEFSGENTAFSGAKFLGETTSFAVAKFTGKYVDFAFVKFASRRTNFWYARFSGEYTSFNGAKFLGEVTGFIGAEFSGNGTYFGWTKFLSGETLFLETKFSGKEVDFFYTQVTNKALFYRNVLEAKTTFTGLDLRTCLFIELDLTKVDFSLIDWGWRYKLGNERALLRVRLGELIDELLFHRLFEKRKSEEIGGKHLRSNDFYLKTSEIYRQLKVQFHTKRDFAKAGMFHFREQECKRMACKLPQEFFKWIFLWILRLSCGYGEKLRNVGLSSLALVFIFGIIYMFLGLHNTDQNESLFFQYSLNTFTITSLGTILKDFLTSLIFSIKGFFPLWRFQQYKIVGDFANLVAGVEFLLGAFMIGLFVYVFRRRMDK